MSLCKLVQHWNGNVVILMAFSSLVALKVVTLTTFSATSDENFIKMMTFLFQWKAISKQHCYGIQKQHWPSTKAILTQHKSDTDPVQKRFRPGTIAILSRYKSDTVFSTVSQRICTGSTGTRYKSGTGIRYWYVYRNGVQDVYRKVPYRYLVPYTTIPNWYHLPSLNSTGTGTDRYRNVYWEAHKSNFVVTWCLWSNGKHELASWHEQCGQRYSVELGPFQILRSVVFLKQSDFL